MVTVRYLKDLYRNIVRFVFNTKYWKNVYQFVQNKRKLTSIVVFCRLCSCKRRISRVLRSAINLRERKGAPPSPTSRVQSFTESLQCQADFHPEIPTAALPNRAPSKLRC